MKRVKSFELLLGSIMVLLLVFLSCSNTTVTSTSTSNISTTTASITTAGNWWDKFGTPQYGGEVTCVTPSVENNFDPFNPMGSICLMYDPLFFFDPNVDPSIHPYQNEWVEPQYYAGVLAESWEMTDPLKMTVKVRQGIHWPDKAPTNGREFTASDVEFNYDALLGTGNGYTTPNPFYAQMVPNLEKATASDKYTVVIKFKNASIWSIYNVLNGPLKGMEQGLVSPEWTQLTEEQKRDYKNAAGTGPFEITEIVANTQVTASRNPKYWAYDERYPKNQLPYVDAWKMVVMNDMSTMLASLRTGKIDYMFNPREYPTYQQVDSIKKTNPDIQTGNWPSTGYSVDLRCDKAPFNDIKVRKALQMAVDTQSIAKAVFGPGVEGTPCGLVNPIDKRYSTPYAQWPAALQSEYSYNPDQAKKLLTEAGYANGFQTSCVMAQGSNMSILESIKAYFKDVGVDMEIQVMDQPTFWAYIAAGKNEAMALNNHSGMVDGPLSCITQLTSKEVRNGTHNNDTTFEAMAEKMANATSEDEAIKIMKEADSYAMSQHWFVTLFGDRPNIMWQQYFKGFNGQCLNFNSYVFFEQMWIDQNLKKTLGR